VLSVGSVELPTKKGDYFEGHMIWDTCTQRKPDVIGFEVTDVNSCDYFTPVVKVTNAPVYLPITTAHRRRLFFFLPRAKDELPPFPPFLSPHLLSTSHPLTSPSLPLEAGPLNTARESGGAL